MKKTNTGGVSYDTERNSYRGFVSIRGIRLATKRYPTRIGAKRALTRLINSATNN
jgi:hypothetical protein